MDKGASPFPTTGKEEVVTETKTTLAGRTFVEAYGEGFLTAFLLAFLGRLLGSGSWRNRSFLLHFTGHELDRARRGEESRTRTIPLFSSQLWAGGNYFWKNMNR